MNCSDHGSQSLSPQAQAKHAAWSTYRLTLKKSMTCPGLGKLCVYKRCCLYPEILLTVLILTLQRLTTEAVVPGNLRAAVSHFRPWRQVCIQALLFVEHAILESSARTPTDRCHNLQGCREFQVNPTCPSVSALSVFPSRESADSPQTQEDM